MLVSGSQVVQMKQPEPSQANDRLGLTAEQVSALRQRFGWNELPKAERTAWGRILARQFTGVLVVILIVAAGIAFALGEMIDTIAIGLVVLLNGILGFVQDWRAETALEALRNMLSPRALVLRDGREQFIAARELVPGDLVIVDAGGRVPADLQLTSAVQLLVDESVLTGESVPVDKAVSDEVPMLFAGTSVAAGRAQGLVIAIGTETKFGQIALLTGSVGPAKARLEIELALLAKQLGVAALVIAVAIGVIGVVAGRGMLEMFMTGLSLAVAMVPEGLPAVVTITLALGASAMVRQQALARRLQAVESLGAASVICTDKTGTLTENKMTATQIWMPHRTYRVTGTGYDPAGHIQAEGARVRAADDPALAALLGVAITCNHARLSQQGDVWTTTGAATEAALVTLAYKGWAAVPDPNAVLGEIPFSSERKRMSVLVRRGDGCLLQSKGAPEQILALASHYQGPDGALPLDAATRARIEQAYGDMAAEGLRVIALASRVADTSQLDENDLQFLGLVGLIDPPRPEVKPAIAAARAAGIRVIMISGDSAVTARAIATQLAMPVTIALTGDDLETLDDAALAVILRQDVLFARTAPAHKMRIVKVLQGEGQIVAMTGDGVNDAPALRQADIGVSMGQRGTDVAKDASDLVLLDDNFATIVRAVAEGRRQFDNVKKFVRYLLSSNAGEVLAILVNILIGGPLVFLATQILWMNLVTDGVTAVALGLEKSESGQMRQPPRVKDAPILGGDGLAMILLFGVYTASASLWLFYQLLPLGEALARTTAFTAMVVFEKASVFAFRSLRQSCFSIGWFSNPLLLLALVSMLSAQAAAVYWPPMQALLHTVALGWDQWQLILALALPLVILPELVKLVLGWRRGRDQRTM